MKHTLSVLVENQPGVLARVAGLFSRRGYNIESIAVGATETPGVARMIIVVDSATCHVESIIKNLHKLIEVLKVTDLTEEPMVDRELVLIKVKADATNRAEVLQIAQIFRANIVDVSEHSLVVEVTGDEGKIEGIIDLLRPFGIREIVRTGVIAIARGNRASSSNAFRPKVIA